MALISIFVPLVNRSINRKKDASYSRSPGASRSSERMLRISKGREERRDRIRRNRNWVAPSLYFKVREGVAVIVVVMVSREIELVGHKNNILVTLNIILCCRCSMSTDWMVARRVRGNCWDRK